MVKAHSLEVHEFRLLQFTGELGVGNLDVTQVGGGFTGRNVAFFCQQGAVNLPDRRDTRKGRRSLDGKPVLGSSCSGTELARSLWREECQGKPSQTFLRLAVIRVPGLVWAF